MPNGTLPWQRWGCAACLAALLTGCAGDSSRAGAGDQPVAESVRAAIHVPPPDDGEDADPVPASLRDVMGSGVLVGRRVRVTGRCVTRENKRNAGVREEWQLASEGIAIVVVGPMPKPCASRRNVTVTITALVAEDTLPAIGDFPPAPRRFLVFTGGRVE